MMSMVIKRDRVVTYHVGPPPIKFHDSLIMWSFEITWQTKNISTIWVSMATKLDRIVTYRDGLLPIKLHNTLITWYWKITRQTKIFLSSLSKSLWPLNLGMVTYHEGLRAIKPHDALIMWSCEILWQTKIIISPLSQSLWPPDLGGWQLTWMGSYPYRHWNPWSRGLSKSHHKLKPSHLHYRNTYGHQTWQNTDLPWATPTHKITWLFGHLVFQDHVTNWNHYIATITVSVGTKLGRMLTYLERLLLIK